MNKKVIGLGVASALVSVVAFAYTTTGQTPRTDCNAGIAYTNGTGQPFVVHYCPNLDYNPTTLPKVNVVSQPYFAEAFSLAIVGLATIVIGASVRDKDGL